MSNKNFVICNICKKELNYHMKKMHNISIAEYKELYPNSLVISKTSAEKKSNSMKLAISKKTSWEKGYNFVRISDKDWRPELVFESSERQKLHSEQLVQSRLKKL